MRHAPGRKQTLERGLAALAGIERAHANTATGNLLVHFDQSVPLGRITIYVAALLRGEVVLRDGGPLGDAVGERWHTRPVGEVSEELGGSPTQGLSARVARERLKTHGPNVLPLPAPRSAIGILVGQFTSLPVALLGVAAGVSLLTGGLLEFAAIAGVVALNGAIGFAVESRSERTISRLDAASIDQPATVIRDGKHLDIHASQVVPGDLVSLRRGDVVPADARVVSVRGLTISEAMLTGESVPVAKTPAPMPERPAPLGERRNMVYRGTAVTGGSGTAIVVATGAATEVGHIQRLLLGAAAPRTPMQHQLNAIGQQLVWLGLAVCGALFGVGVLRGFGLLRMVRSAVSLAVAAIPEALPTVATTTLALGIEDMRRRNVLVRRLDAVETLASVRVFCFDKTGTLTMNRMSVAAVACDRVLTVGPDGTDDGATVALGADARMRRLLLIGVLCSETEIERKADGSSQLSGSPTENALVQLAFDAGMDVAAERRRLPRISVQHRSDAYRFMLTRHRRDGGILVAVKGSPEEVLALCTRRLTVAGPVAISHADRDEIARANMAMAERALRVLGLAFKEIDDHDGVAGSADASDLVWVGLAGLADPVRPGAPALMRIIRDAGIHRVIMTGDQVATARAIAKELGLADDGREVEVVDAADLGAMAPARIAELARRVQVFARVSPADKLAIVRALQASGVVVAMAGDGVNDSPAMKAADTGIAMGWSGAEAAREVADVVLQSDDLTAIGVAIERGRTTYTNVRKSVRYLIGTNLSEIAVVLAATSAGFPEPLTPLQLLWLNLVSDVLPALGLAFEPPDPGLLRQAPQANGEGVLRNRDFGASVADGSVIAGGALAACGYGALRYGVSAEARTMTLGSLVIAQLLHALTCRSNSRAASGRPPNRPLTAAVGASLAVQAAVLLLPGLRGMLGMAPLGALDLAVTVGSGILPWLVNEARKPEAPQLPAAGLAPAIAGP